MFRLSTEVVYLSFDGWGPFFLFYEYCPRLTYKNEVGTADPDEAPSQARALARWEDLVMKKQLPANKQRLSSRKEEM